MPLSKANVTKMSLPALDREFGEVLNGAMNESETAEGFAFRLRYAYIARMIAITSEVAKRHASIALGIRRAHAAQILRFMRDGVEQQQTRLHEIEQAVHPYSDPSGNGYCFTCGLAPAQDGVLPAHTSGTVPAIVDTQTMHDAAVMGYYVANAGEFPNGQPKYSARKLSEIVKTDHAPLDGPTQAMMAARHYMDKSEDPGHGPDSDCETCRAHLNEGQRPAELSPTTSRDALRAALVGIVIATKPYHQNDTAGRPWLANALAAIDSTPEDALERAARLQTEFWEALTDLEQAYGVDVDSTRDLSGLTIEDLQEDDSEDDSEEDYTRYCDGCQAAELPASTDNLSLFDHAEGCKHFGMAWDDAHAQYVEGPRQKNG